MSGAREQVSRLLALVPYLQTRTDVSLAQVAADFGVRPEQIMKDLKVLWMCGLPGLTPDKMIDVDFGAIEDDPEGVVRIDNADFLSRPVRLGSSEASALIVALRALREGSPDSSHEVIDRCLVKLEDATATGTATPQVEVHLPRSPATIRHAGLLERAIESNRQARIDYYVPTRDETTQRTVDPLELLTGEGHDYLDAWCHLAQARRLFRLDRMHAVEIVDEPARSTTSARGTSPRGCSSPGRTTSRPCCTSSATPAGWPTTTRSTRSRSSATAASRPGCAWVTRAGWSASRSAWLPGSPWWSHPS